MVKKNANLAININTQAPLLRKGIKPGAGADKGHARSPVGASVN